jgi:hypothetical protein
LFPSGFVLFEYFVFGLLFCLFWFGFHSVSVLFRSISIPFQFHSVSSHVFASHLEHGVGVAAHQALRGLWADGAHEEALLLEAEQAGPRVLAVEATVVEVDGLRRARRQVPQRLRNPAAADGPGVITIMNMLLLVN